MTLLKINVTCQSIMGLINNKPMVDGDWRKIINTFHSIIQRAKNISGSSIANSKVITNSRDLPRFSGVKMPSDLR